MGPSQVKDEQIDIYMEVHKEFYMAGQQVEGIVFLNAKSSRLYKNLALRLVGNEHVQWSVGMGRHRKTYSNKYRSYNNVFGVIDFQGKVEQGQYSFPFSFILPFAMPSSFTHSDDCYIQYTLSAVLNHIEQHYNQIYELKLNIMEPLRGKLDCASITKTTNVQCCECCKDYGHTMVNLSSDKNLVMMGESMNLSVMIDNSLGEVEVERTSIYFEERRVMISSEGKVWGHLDRFQILHVLGKVNPGQIENFNFSPTIPQWNSYTAIGRITARYFLLRLATQMGGCCANSSSILMHIVVNNANPAVIKQNKMQLFTNWHPNEQHKIMNNNMPPFVNKPLPNIPFDNLGQNNVSQNQMEQQGQMGQQPSFQNDSLNEISQNDTQYQQYRKKGNYQAL